MKIFKNTRYKGNYNGQERLFTITAVYGCGVGKDWKPMEYDLLQDGEQEPKRVDREKLINWIENKILVRSWSN